MHNELIQAAKNAVINSYSPYSCFAVGAALLAGGRVYTGTNVECASYGGTICAERTAFVKAVSEGERIFEAIAVAADGRACFPCGICLQFMAEFCDPDNFVILLSEESEGGSQSKRYTLRELLPYNFKL